MEKKLKNIGLDFRLVLDIISYSDINKIYLSGHVNKNFPCSSTVEHSTVFETQLSLETMIEKEDEFREACQMVTLSQV